MSWDNNPYYHPEALGLTFFAEIGGYESYEFDIMAIWEKDGKFYWAVDSGCSCPSPFEDFNSLDDLDSGNARKAIKAVQDYASESYRNVSGDAFSVIERLAARV